MRLHLLLQPTFPTMQQSKLTPPSLDHMISRSAAMNLLGLSRNWFVARQGKTLTVYKLDGNPNSTVYFDKREVMALFQATQVQQSDNAAA